jgi:hypothetical protein
MMENPWEVEQMQEEVYKVELDNHSKRSMIDWREASETEAESAWEDSRFLLWDSHEGDLGVSLREVLLLEKEFNRSNG